jgi:hypothetical protein
LAVWPEGYRSPLLKKSGFSKRGWPRPSHNLSTNTTRFKATTLLTATMTGLH